MISLKNILRILTILIIFVFLLILSIFTINDNLRTKSLSVIKHYYIISKSVIIKNYLKNNNYEEVSKNLLDQINMSLRFSNTKTTLHESIYNNIKIAFDKVIIQEHLLFLEEPVKKLLQIDNNLYLANVWMAKILDIKNDHISKKNDHEALKYIYRAITISPANNEAYRVGLKIAYENNWISETENLCKKYNNSFLGGSLQTQYKNFFEGNNLTNMGMIVQKAEKSQKVFTNYGIKFNEFYDYEFIFDVTKDINEFSIILGMLPGISLDFDYILLKSENKKIKISKNKYSIFSKNAYFLEDNKLIFVSNTDELININLGKEIQDISSVVLKLKFKKLRINNICN